MRMKRKNKEDGFTLIEVMAVMIILAIMAVIAIPKVAASSEQARKNADITTGNQIKAALDFYQVQKGSYPKLADMTVGSVASGGVVACAGFIPEYMAKLDAKMTQQSVDATHRGFGVKVIPTSGGYPATENNLIVIYLAADGSGAEVRTMDASLSNVLWSSAE